MLLIAATLVILVALAAFLARHLARTPVAGLFARLRMVLATGDLGALTLAQAAVISDDDLQRGVVETFVIESSVLDRIPFMGVEGNSYAYREELTLPGVEFRAVNSAYAESTGTFNPRSENIVILGGDADVDVFIEQTRSNLNGQRAEQTRLKTKALAFKFQDAFINGDTAVDANSFDGLKKRLTGAQVLDAATNGIGPVAGAHDFFDQLDALIAAVEGQPDALYMNKAVRTRIMNSGRRLGGTDWMKEAFFEDTETPSVKRFPTYNGIPMLDIGTKADGTQIIPQTETMGTSNVTSSIYAVRFGGNEGDHAVTGLMNGTVSVRDLGEQDVKPVYRTRIETFIGLALFGSRGAARLRGVLAT